MAASLKIESTEPDQTDVYQDLSSRLYRVLDVVGVSEEMREEHKEKTSAHEILITAVYKVTEDGVLSMYIFGSQYEGTTTRGLHSDTDVLFCDERRPVVENIDGAPVEGEALLMLSDDTKPGYVKLQQVSNRAEMTINEWEVTSSEDVDHRGRILIKNVNPAFPNREKYGPAVNFQEGEATGEYDVVSAYRCRNVPSFADEWLHRPHPHQWPPQEQLDRMHSYGCFLVGVAHPMSVDRETEWRISFSLQERDLMCSLNPTQHKCYVLLKMIKKDIIQPRVGKSLSSYHCKTCIFHLAESHGTEQWTPHNLVSCILECFRLILNWVRQGYCPNFFIKEENMFDKLDQSTLRRLSHVLQEMLSNEVKFIYEIKCDDIGTLQISNMFDILELFVKREFKYPFYISMMKQLLQAKNRVCRYIDNAPIHRERVSRANHIVQYLEDTTVITEHKPREVRMVLDRLVPYIRLVIVQMTCSNELVQIQGKYDNEEIQALAKEVQLCKHCDLISSRLIVASLYLQCNKLDRCQKILQDCEISLEPYVTSICGCHDYVTYTNIALGLKVVDENLSFERYQIECNAACVIFLPHEANLAPAALRYEMYRSVYTPPGSRNEERYFWFDWIVVDSKIYMHYMQYILYSKTSKPAYKQDVINKLQHLIITDESLGHKETALNLLGSIYIQENKVQDAFDCFCRSLAIQPLHNAAKWHMAILLKSLITPQTIYKRK